MDSGDGQADFWGSNATDRFLGVAEVWECCGGSAPTRALLSHQATALPHMHTVHTARKIDICMSKEVAPSLLSL